MTAELAGRRRDADVPVDELEPGDYRLTRTELGPVLWCVLPSGVIGHLECYPHERSDGRGGSEINPGWTLQEHDDGTVTVSPSIHDRLDGWHGFLQRGVWRQA